MNCRICGAALPVGAMFCGECGSSTRATPSTRRRPDLRPSDTTVIQPVPATPSVVSVPIEVPGEVPGEVPSEVPVPVVVSAPAGTAPAPGVTYVLQFSTGETVSVQGTGLVGRRPLPQPAEHFDHLIQIADRGMSVSKSHLEFGQHEGELWVSDRYSGNGTVIRRPGEVALRCEPGRRYLVPRGSRVEVADQFFVVS